MILEHLMYNRLYKHLKENNSLYEKQFGLQRLVDKIFDSFEKEQLTLGVFIDFFKGI